MLKKLMICLLVLLVMCGCSSGNSTTSSNSSNSTNTTSTDAESEKNDNELSDIKDVADDIKEVGNEIKDTLSESFSEAFGDMFSSSSSEENKNEENEKPKEEVSENAEYLKATVDEMNAVLNDNALKAKKTYEGQYVEVTGKLGTIDSNGAYICLDELNNPYSFMSVQCFVKNNDQLDHVLDMSSGKKYTIRIKITMVGEVLGYAGDIIEFVD